MQRTNRPVWRVIASLFMLLVVAALAVPSLAQESTPDSVEVEPVIVDPTIQSVWDMTDGQIIRGEVQRAWAFGPEPIAAAYEYYPQSPTEFRKVVYFDKGRLDLLSPKSPTGSIWKVSGALLTTEMLSGRIQLGEEEFVSRKPAAIPLVGDLEQDNPVTYETLARHSSVAADEDDEKQADSTPERQASDRNLNQVGKDVTELLAPDGTIHPGAVLDQGVRIVEYDELVGHNVASPFAGWATDLGIPALNILGLPVTEPYWLETEIDQVPTLVLIQAFERRTLTYTPSNPEGWKVESGNVGLHYRLWRDLERPERPELARMAAEIPFGEEILGAARNSFIDPYIFVAISMHTTDGNPFESSENGGHGLMGAKPELDADQESPDLNDPGINARIAAAQFAGEMYVAWDWPTILTNYYLLGHIQADAAGAASWANAVVDTSDELLEIYPPSGPRVDPVREEGKLIGEGRAAHYDPSYTAAWWERTMELHASWGNAVDYWAPNENGLYCVHPDYLIGERLKLEANGRVVECTIGDRVAVPHQIGWRAKWTVELSWSTFTALGLDRNNDVVVSYLGDRIIEPTPTPEPSQTPEPTVTPNAQIPGAGRPDQDVPPPSLPTQEPTPSPTATAPAPGTTTPEPTVTGTAPSATLTESPAETPPASPTEPVTGTAAP